MPLPVYIVRVYKGLPTLAKCQTGSNALLPNADSNQCVLIHFCRVHTGNLLFENSIQISNSHLQLSFDCRVLANRTRSRLKWKPLTKLSSSFFVHGVNTVVKKNCFKERIQGKETAPVNAPEKTKKSEDIYICIYTCTYTISTVSIASEPGYVQLVHTKKLLHS